MIVLFRSPTGIKTVMSRQSLHKSAIRLTTALALLVSVMISPIRTASAASGGYHPEYLRRDFGIPGKTPTNHRPHVPATSRVVQVTAVSSQSKPELSSLPARGDTHLVCPFPTVPPGQDSTALAAGRSIHPLRC